MTAVLISIQPKWCDLILNGTKTIEVRKSAPRLKTPFKCYIYCTNPKYEYEDFFALDNGRFIYGGKKIVGEFVCDRIFPITVEENGPFSEERGGGYSEDYSAQGFHDHLTNEEFDAYLNGKPGYGWHISDLKIYVKPLNLKDLHRDCSTCGYVGARGGNCDFIIKRPPQSWCYVEGLT